MCTNRTPLGFGAGILMLAACLIARGLPLERHGDVWRFGDQRLSIQLHAGTGAFVGIDLDGETVARDAGTVQYFDIRTSNRWLTGSGLAPRLIQVHRTSEREIAATVRTGDWTAEFHYTLHPESARIRRWVRIVWHGPEGKREKLRGFWLRTPQMNLSDGGFYVLPGHWPPLRRLVGEFERGRKISVSRSPGALVVQIAPRLSGIWLSDELTPRSDRPSASVVEGRGNLRVGQGYQCEGWALPGKPQDVGDAWMWLVRCNGEQAMERIHDLLRDLGHAPPRDRPPWFHRAVLYSFHPGGTIGSQFRDLGGFRAAADLLDAIRALGCTAVWLLPIEDSGVYHPRDYYKLQKGLGTFDEYRGLVQKAHALGMHVLRDIVPHGGTNDCPRARQHPEWLLRTENGDTLPYWCFDFNWPSWRKYMADVARHYMESADIDGFRVDAVYGSKISNWNPDIPYARASFARLQGGLHMLAAIRNSVKSVKPQEGGVLAEVGSSAHGCVSDAVYDFTLCYTVLHDLRRRPVEQVVPDIQRWLYEQDQSEAPDLLRLRHIESHDSLRSLLWYGLRPQRALMAFAAWIHGIPLVYHEMEHGSSAVFRRIFRIRNTLPELTLGDMDPIAVEAPPGVFTCLRTAQTDAAVVAVNLAPFQATGTARLARSRLPRTLRSGPVQILDAWRNTRLESADSAHSDALEIPLDLPPFGFTVYALRRGVLPDVPLESDPWDRAPRSAERPAAPPENAVALARSSWRLWIDRTTGLPSRFDVAGVPGLGRADLVLDAATCSAASEICELRTQPREVRTIRAFGDRTLEIIYRATDAGPELDMRWSEPGPPAYAALYWPVLNARRWYAACAEGVFEDTYRVRHRTTDGVMGSIYWRPQGTAAVWDSLLHPLGADSATAGIGALAAGGRTAPAFLFFDPNARPARVRWLDRVGDRCRLALLAAWSDPDARDILPKASRRFVMRVAPGGAPDSLQPAGPVRGEPSSRLGSEPREFSPGVELVPAVGGWLVSTPRYRLRLSRSGMIIALWSADGSEAQAYALDGDLYTDAGFSSKNVRYAASNEVEAAAIFRKEADGTVRLRFTGRVRGFYRFDLLPTPIWYVAEYTIAPDQPGFRMTYAVLPEAAPRGNRAFFGWRIAVPGLDAFKFLRGGRTIAEDRVRDPSRRALQSRDLTPPTVPDEVHMKDRARRTLLCLSDLRWGAARPPANVFVHGRLFFLTWYDGPPDRRGAGEWSWFTAMLTPGAPPCAPFGPHTCELRSPEQATLPAIRMPGFEEAVRAAPRFLEAGIRLPGVHGRSAWKPPHSGGRLVSDVVHSGRVAAFVENRTGGYLLWTQELPPDAFPPGSRWRLTAWVRGENIVQGTPAWKTGTARFAFIVAGKAQYASSKPLTGTFDWQPVQVEATVPEGVQRILIQIGLNGARGRMWIDDAALERLPAD